MVILQVRSIASPPTRKDISRLSRITPIAHKKAVAKSLTNRANYIPTTSDYRAKELKQVTVALLANG